MEELSLSSVLNYAQELREVRVRNPLVNHNHCAIRFDIIIEGYSPRGNAVRVNFKRPDFKTMRKMINSRLKGKVKHFNNIQQICSWSNSSDSPRSCSKGQFG